MRDISGLKVRFLDLFSIHGVEEVARSNRVAPTRLTVDYAERIVVDREIRFGKPVIKGTRICVSDILDFLAAGDTETDILADFPQISSEDVRACLAFAADRDRYTRIAG